MVRKQHMTVLTSVFCVLAAVCFGYYVFAASYAGFRSAFLWFWLLAGVGCLAVAAGIVLDARYKILSGIPGWIRYMALGIVLLGLVVFITMEGLIVSRMQAEPEAPVEYLVVLGAQVRGTRITKSLRKRLEAAETYLDAHPETKVVCAGGQGSGEDISEAEAMEGYLLEQGIAKERILLEDTSTSTYENLRNTFEMIGNKEAKIAVVTNNFHVYRGMHLAKYVGFQNVQGLAGKSDNRLLPNYMVREGIALFKELIIHRT